MIKGFSKLLQEEKQSLVLKQLSDSIDSEVFEKLRLGDQILEELIQGFSENVISIFPFPFSIVPNFLIDNKEYLVPFVTEESSVVAAAAKAAKYWYERGGFKSQIIGTTKTGHVHFKTNLDKNILEKKILAWEKELLQSVYEIDKKMIARGGGIQHLELIDKTSDITNYFQLELGFNTCNAMGANYMNSCLEGIAESLQLFFSADSECTQKELNVIMCILSNYSPQNAVRVWVECDIESLDDGKLGMTSSEFAHKFTEAVKIAEADVSRAVTHNKGLYNGVDSVVLATGNDWRAIEANGHAYASRDGQYRSLSHAEILNNQFRFELTIPLQVGTVGGITALHPLTKLSMEIMGKPNANDLMKIMASAGLASNFAAVRALTTTGIQKGHMKMHLNNLLASFNATRDEIELSKKFFADKTISNSAVEQFITELRNRMG